MVTFEELRDEKFSNKQIVVQSLKIWEKDESGYQLKQYVHSPCQTHGQKSVQLEFLAAGGAFVLSTGPLVQIWKKVEIRLEGQKPSTKW